MPTAFVTGATGFLGLNLVEHLLREGWRVVAFHRPSSDLRFLSRFACERVQGDLADPASVAAAIPGGTDVVFHVAGDTNMWSRRNDAQTQTNVLGTRAVATAARGRGVGRLVHTSSIAAYGLHDRVIDEDTPQHGRDSWIHYLRTKALAEDEVRDAIGKGLDAVMVNPANILGAYDLHNWSTMVWLTATGKLPGAPPGRGSFCEAGAVARAHVAAARAGRTGANYLLGGIDASYLELVQVIGEVCGKPVPREATPAWKLGLYARLSVAFAAVTGRTPVMTPEKAALVCGNMVCTSARAERELEYQAVPLRDMVVRCHDWMRAEGRLPGPPDGAEGAA